MITTYKDKSITWIDIETPSKEEIRTIMNEYNLAPEVAEDLIDPTIQTRADQYKDLLYFVLHFPLHISKKMSFDKKTEEIDFVIGKDFVLTIHYSPVPVLLSLQKSLETDTILHHTDKTKNVETLFFYIVQKLYKDTQNKIEDLRSNLMSYEEKMFSGQEKEMIYEISKINQIIIYFKESLNSHKDFFDFIKNNFSKNTDQNISKHIQSATADYTRIKYSLRSLSLYAHELRETNNSLLTTKQNEVMKLLAIVSFVTFPLALISSIFGMNTDYLPIVGMEYDFAIVIGMMGIMAIGFFTFFKKKKWL